MTNLLTALSTGKLLFDGAMGTELQKRGLTQDPVLLNLTHARHVTGIHRAYLDAGADIIIANTFGAYKHKHDNYKEIIKSAIANARAALEGKPGKWLALDLGPTGLMLEPYGDATKEECADIFTTAIDAGVSQGVDLILVETMMDLAELEIAVTSAKATGLPVFATMTFDKNGRTMMGTSINDMVSLLQGLGADAIGMNCGFGPDIYAGLAKELRKATSLPTIIQPNAGLPVTKADGSSGYDLSVGEFVKIVSEIDANVIGGCCGTSPEHIAGLR